MLLLQVEAVARQGEERNAGGQITRVSVFNIPNGMIKMYGIQHFTNKYREKQAKIHHVDRCSSYAADFAALCDCLQRLCGELDWNGRR